MKLDMIKRNRQRKAQDKVYDRLRKAGYTDEDRLQYLRPDGYYYTLKDLRQYIIWGIELVEA